MNHINTKLAGILITLLFCLPAAPILAKPQPQTTPTPQHYHTIFTNETNITVTITAIRSMDRSLDNPSFQADVIIDGVHNQGPIYKNQPDVYSPWAITKTVPPDEEWVNITIVLTDTNTGKLCDLSGCHEGTDRYNDTVANIQYSLKTGHWVGDDFAFYWDEGHNGTDYQPYHGWWGVDDSGYGRLNGCDDGSYNQHDNDAELYFTITQPTPAADGIPYWLKTQIYHLDPYTDYTGYDPNNDSIPITWDYAWGYDPFANDSHATLDPDHDGLTNYKEYLTSQWGSDPSAKDLFVEMDRMADSPRGEVSNLPNSSKEAIRTLLGSHNIRFHLDDGCMGGSDIIPFKENTTDHELRTLYYQYFLHGNVNNWRVGVFHWGVVLYNASYGGFNFWNGWTNAFDSFQISSKRMEQKITTNTSRNRMVIYGTAYMHELGHNIGLDAFPGIDNQNSKWPWQKDWWKYRPYVSLMNYGYMYQGFVLSDGHRGKNDYDDWGHIDLTAFNSGFD